MKKLTMLTLLMIFILSSCVTKRKCNERFPCFEGKDSIKTVIIKETLRDTVFWTSPDYGLVSALLECDSLGNVYIKQIIDLKSIKDSDKPEIQINDNIIKVVVPVDSNAIYLTLKDRLEIQNTTTTVIPTQKEVNILTGFQWFQIWLGRILSIIVLIYLILKFILWKK